MRTVVLTAMLASGLSACGFFPLDAGKADAGVDAGMTAQRCEQLILDWNAAVAPLDRTCATERDCVVPGDRADCDCYPLLAQVDHPAAVNFAIYQASAAAEMERLFWSECPGIEGVSRLCDVGPASGACVDGQCQANARQCCMCQP